MIIKPTFLEGVFEVENKIFKDHRGLFVKTFQADVFKQSGLNSEFKESFFSVSKKNVLRGMHFQLPPNDHAKLVYVTQGEILDVAVDLRPESPTYKQHFSVILNEYKMLYIPTGFAHGFLTISDYAVFSYKCSDYYDPDDEGGLAWNDAEVGIKWPVEQVMEVTLSEKDKAWPKLARIK